MSIPIPDDVEPVFQDGKLVGLSAMYTGQKEEIDERGWQTFPLQERLRAASSSEAGIPCVPPIKNSAQELMRMMEFLGSPVEMMLLPSPPRGLPYRKIHPLILAINARTSNNELEICTRDREASEPHLHYNRVGLRATLKDLLDLCLANRFRITFVRDQWGSIMPRPFTVKGRVLTQYHPVFRIDPQCPQACPLALLLENRPALSYRGRGEDVRDLFQREAAFWAGRTPQWIEGFIEGYGWCVSTEDNLEYKLGNEAGRWMYDQLCKAGARFL